MTMALLIILMMWQPYHTLGYILNHPLPKCDMQHDNPNGLWFVMRFKVNGERGQTNLGKLS